MIGHRDMQLNDYVDILRRRKWVLVIPTVLGCALAFGVSLLLPERYTSQALVLVEQQKVPEAYVRSVVTEELNQRLTSMKQQVLSRSQLQSIIERLGIYRNEVGSVPMEELVDRLRQGVIVTPIQPIIRQSRNTDLPGFYVAFTAPDPRTAQLVCAEITSKFLEQDLRRREARAQGTTDFLARQLEEAKKNLDDQDKKLADFKRQYIGQLPEQEQTNMNILMGLNTQMDAVTQLIIRTRQDKTYLDSILAQQLAAWKAGQSGGNPATMEQQLTAAQDQLLVLQGRYTDNHPDVVKLKKEIEQIKNRIAEASANAQKPSGTEAKAGLVEPPEIQQLRGQIHLAEQTIRDKTLQQERMQEQIRVYQSRVQLSPIVEQKYKELTRDYQTALNFYNEMLSKKTQSEMATDLERRQQGEQFRVMDAPGLPERPSFPNRPLMAAGGLGGGLALGLGLVLLLELKDHSLRTERDVEACLNLVVLAMMPVVGEFKNGKRPKESSRPEVEKGLRVRAGV
jgi:polysaccharide chain length determinant protein (PEP-CTERM system associated)